MKYNVRVYLSTFYDMEVEAENEQEAKEIAESCENWDNDDVPNNANLQEGETEVINIV